VRTTPLLLIPFIAAILPLCLAIEQQDNAVQLARVKRIFVDQLGGGAMSDQMRDMIIAALQNSGLFAITENAEKADATIRGSADDKVFNEEHNTSESIGLHTNAAAGGTSKSNMTSSVSSSHTAGAGITDNETSHIQERHHEASASIRLIDADGDVIWSTTQESGGGKFRGAMADVADKIARQLLDDTRKARRPPPPLAVPQ
jgi:hypothetical protein